MDNVTYSQNREDIYLSGFFDMSKPGFYVDVGANHPIHDSVTKYFYERGWRGINIEPIPRLYNLLVNDRPKDINLKIGISNKRGVLNFREYPEGNGLSTFSDAMKEGYKNNPKDVTIKHKDYKIDVYPIREVFINHKVKSIDFMKIDVEGYEYEVIEGNDWNKYRPKVICIEANHVINDWRNILNQNGYKLTIFDGLNEYYVDSRNKSLNSQYDFPKIDTHPIDYNTFKQQEVLKERVNQETKKLIHQELINQSLLEQIRQLSLEIESNKRIRKSAKQFLKSIDSAIKVQILKLNHRKVVPKKPLLIDNNISYKALIDRLKIYDLENIVDHNPDKLSYRIVLRMYVKSRNLVFSILKRTIKVARVIKNA